jgi:hypothetical protein
MLPYGVRTFLQRIVRFTSDHLPSPEIYHNQQRRKPRISRIKTGSPSRFGATAPVAKFTQAGDAPALQLFFEDHIRDIRAICGSKTFPSHNKGSHTVTA